MAKWIDIGPVSEYPAGSKTCVAPDGQPVVLCHLNGDAPGAQPGLHAVHNVCPHAGLPLGDGELQGAVLTCPYHGYAFNIATGCNIDYPDDTPVTRLPVRIVDDRVEIDVDSNEN